MKLTGNNVFLKCLLLRDCFNTKHNKKTQNILQYSETNLKVSVFTRLGPQQNCAHA